MITVPLANGAIDDSAASRARSLQRLAHHRAVLEANGIAAVSDLGTLALSGTVATVPGSIVRAAAPISPSGPPGITSFAGTATGTGPRARPLSVMLASVNGAGVVELSPGFVEAVSPAGAAMVTPGLGATVPINTAYFCAQTVNLADNTTIVLTSNNLYLMFVAEHINVGRNVTFTYARQLLRSSPTSWAPGNQPAKPDKALTPDSTDAVRGSDGTSGDNGGTGYIASNAPEVEVWTLRLKGSPVVDLRGADGQAGGRGRDGGEGGDGADGAAETYDFWGFCKSAAGWGGDGGTGGNGGSGGAGASGSHGGRFSLFAPREVLAAYAAAGFRITTDGGSGGRGGGPGAAGAGGAGGALGSHPKNCASPENRTSGKAGAIGAIGTVGTPGATGGHHPDAVAFLPITEADFFEALTRPALLSALPDRAVSGTTITVNTLRVQGADTLTINENPVPMTVVAENLITFVLPVVAGGQSILRIRQADGTLSNRMSFYVDPHVTHVGDGLRAKPGAKVSVRGSGFATGARVLVNGEEMSGVGVASAAELSFTLRRPTATVENPDGEIGHCTVVLADGTPSNTLDFTIDTLHLVVLGDSVAWGQGLRPQEKFTAQVEAIYAATMAGIKSYTTNLAHSGAIIGVGDATVEEPINGEVPTSYPTVMQQLDMVSAPDRVDLVLITAGLCDLNVLTVLNPLNTPPGFASQIDEYCHRDLRTLLRAVTDKCPNATVVATSYFPMISSDSDTTLLEAFIVAAGISIAGLPGGALTGGLVPQIVTNCRAFYDLSNIAIRAAVDEVNDQLPEHRVHFADAGFNPSNAALASEPWLYGINANLSPQDPFTSADRAAACHLNAARTDVFKCERASIGHPNPAGARAYADAIMKVLQTDRVDPERSLPPFPPGFLFGVATSAWQNEGGITNNDWYAFTTDAKIEARVATITEKGGGPVAHLTPPGDAIRHRDVGVLEADLDRAVGLGINSYRFSVEWSRLMPQRPSHPDPLTDADLDMDAVHYYDHVLDALGARSMTPVVTLNHFTLPIWVLDPPRTGTFSPLTFAGIEIASANDPNFKASMRGWENPEVVDEYLRLVTYLASRWADRVDWWVTMNEPVASLIGVGYFAGVWPPGFTGDGERGKLAYFNLIRAHLRAYEAIKAVAPIAMVGFAHAMMHAKVTTQWSSDLLGDQGVARNQFDYFYNWHILDTIIDGHLDTAIRERVSQRQYLSGTDFANEMGLDPAAPWTTHCDFVGLNYYRSVYVFSDPAVSYAMGYSGGRFTNDLAMAPQKQAHNLLNPLGWEIDPGGFGTLLVELNSRYGLPVLVTENGIPQEVDRTRGAFIAGHLTELLSAVSDGVDVRGYMYWTLCDNWELQEAYRPESHFGLFAVDRSHPEQPRHLTDGATAYSYAIGTNGVGGIRDRFGAISRDGARVRPPRQSPALLAGKLNGEPFHIMLWSDPAGQLVGLMWETSDRLLPVKGAYDTATGTLTLTHPACGSVTSGTINGKRDAGSSTALTGTLTRGTSTLPWTVSHDVLVGTWLGQGALSTLRISRTPVNASDYTGSSLGDELPSGWYPLSVTGQPNALVLESTTGRAEVALSGHSLSGTLTVDNHTESWTAVRLPDPLGFT